MEQHWYFCYTCDLTVSKGCCGACAKACHVGHKVVYSRRSRFFCDCGAGSVPGHECQCLMPSSDPASTSNSRSGIDRADAGNLEDRGADADNLKSAKPRGYRPVTEDSDSEADDDDPNCRGDVDETDDEYESVAPLTSEPGAAKAVAALRDSLLGSGLAASLVALCDRVVDHLRANPPWELPARRGMEQSVALLSLPPPFELAPLPPPPRLLIPDRTAIAATTRHDLVHLRRGFKAGSFEVRPRPEHAAPRELLPAIVMGTLRRSALSCARGSGFLAVAEGDNVCVLDAGALAGVGGAGSIVPVPGSASSASSSEQRVGIRPLSRSGVKFEVSRVLFNPAADEYLAVAGYAQCHVFTLGPKGEIADRLCVGPEEWPLDGMHGALLDVDWVPGRTGALSITVSAHVAVFDLAKSSVAPVLTVSLPPRESDGAPARIVASAFAPRGGENRLLVLSEDGALFSHPVRDGDEGDATIDESCRLALPEVCRGRAGLSVHFSRAHGVALASFDGGVTVLARLHPETGAVVASCVVREDSGSNPDGDRNDEPPEASSPFGPAGFSHWSEACAPPPPPWRSGARARRTAAAVVCRRVREARRRRGGRLPRRRCTRRAAVTIEPGRRRRRPGLINEGGVASSSATLASVIANQPSVLGHAGYQPIDLDVAFLFALRDDGSLQVFAQEPPPPPGIAAADVQQKQLARAAANASAREAIAARLRGARGGDDIGNDENDENADEPKGAAAAFPLDFFERTTCVTGEVTFGGDLARRTSSDSLRFALQSEDSHVEAPAPGAGKVTMSLAKAGHVIVGLRVHLDAGHRPRRNDHRTGADSRSRAGAAARVAPRDGRNRRTRQRRRRRRRTGSVVPLRNRRDAGTTCP